MAGVRGSCALVAVACVCSLSGACGGERRMRSEGSASGPEGGVLTFDAAMIGRDDAGAPRDASRDAPVDAPFDAGPSGACASLPPATTTSSGVRTAFAHLDYAVFPSDHRAVSANFVVTHDGDSRGPLLELFAEIRNDGTSEACQHLPDVQLDFMEIIATVVAAPYYDDFSSVTNDCIAPGQIGVLIGVARGIDESDLAAASSLWMDLDPSTISIDYHAALDGPTMTRADVVGTPEGYVLQGDLRIGATIHNYGLRVYPRDSRGVVVDELLAFPMRLATLYAGSTVPYETDGTDCPFGEHASFQSWITGARSGFFPGLPTRTDRQRAVAATRARMDDIRALR